MPAVVCPSGHANEPRWRYCIECGVPLQEAGALAPTGSGSVWSERQRSTETSEAADGPGREYLVALVILLVALALAGATFAFVLRHRSSVQSSNHAVRSSSHQLGASGGAGDPRAAGIAVNRLLVASEGNRSSVQQAVGQIASCADVTGAVHSLQVAAADREQLISKLGGLDLSALPTSMVDDLTSSWLNSLDSDVSYSRWGLDEGRRGCITGDFSDSNYQAAVETDGQASTSKTAFLTLWDPLAQSNGLPEWQSSEI